MASERDDPSKALLVNAADAEPDSADQSKAKDKDKDEVVVEVTGWRRHCQGRAFLTGLYSVLLLIAAVGNSVFFKKMTNHMPNYPYFLTQVTTLVYIPIFFAIVAYEMMFTNYITKEMTEFPKIKFLWMGVFDALAGIFMVFGGVHTSGSTQQCLLNAVIPVTMVLSYVFLKARYKPLQYLGAGIILSGVLVVVVPGFFQKSSGDTADYPLFNIIFLMNVFPQAMSAVYKEIAFNDIDLDVNYLQAWVALWQLLVTFALIPLNTLKFLGPNSMPWSQLPDAMWNGARCFAGYNSLNYEAPPLNSTADPNCLLSGSSSSIPPCDDCGGAWQPLVLYLVFNCFFNIFIVLVIKYGGAALMYIIMTVRLPLVQIAFSIRALNDPPDPFEWYSIVGLLLILGGLVGYRFGSAQQQKEAAEAAAKAKAEAAADGGGTPSAGADGGEGEVVVVPSLMGMGDVGSRLPVRRRKVVQIPKKTVQVIRTGYYSRLGLDSPRSAGGAGGRLRPGGYSSPIVTKSKSGSPRSSSRRAGRGDDATNGGDSGDHGDHKLDVPAGRKIEMSPRGDSAVPASGAAAAAARNAPPAAHTAVTIDDRDDHGDDSRDRNNSASALLPAGPSSVASGGSGVVVMGGHANAGSLASAAGMNLPSSLPQTYQAGAGGAAPRAPSSRNPASRDTGSNAQDS